MSQGHMDHSLTEQLQACRTPAEAMLLMASWIEDLTARVSQLEQPADPWSQPLDWSVENESRVLPPAPAQATDHTGTALEAAEAARIAAIEALQLELAAATGEEHAALEARLRLMKDTEANVARSYVPEGTRVVESEGFDASAGSIETQAIRVGGNTVQLPKVSEEREAARAAWATKRRAWEFFSLPMEDFIPAYAKGGPMWLYLGARKEVMTMPVQARRELVEEIMLDSPAQAHEVGRDILKDTDGGTPMENQLDAINRMSRR